MLCIHRTVVNEKAMFKVSAAFAHSRSNTTTRRQEMISETERYFDAKDKSFYKKASNCSRSVGISVSP